MHISVSQTYLNSLVLFLLLHAATYDTHYWELVISHDKVENKIATILGTTSTVVCKEETYDDDGAIKTRCRAIVTAKRLIPLHDLFSCLPPVPEWGGYEKRRTASGIPICAHSIVDEKAIDFAARAVSGMLSRVNPLVIHKMNAYGVEVAIISKEQTTTDIPAHGHLKHKRTSDGRCFDKGTRGLGATISCPVLSTGEENILMLQAGENRYPSESILVHEFAHAVMNIGLWDTDLYDAIIRAYKEACEENLYNRTSYVMSNAEEYFAEMSQAWFEATIRTDVTSGVITRKDLKKRDPRLAKLMRTIWGNGRWRYLDDAPYHCFHTAKSSKSRNPGGGTRSSRHGHVMRNSWKSQPAGNEAPTSRLRAIVSAMLLKMRIKF